MGRVDMKELKCSNLSPSAKRIHVEKDKILLFIILLILHIIKYYAISK